MIIAEKAHFTDRFASVAHSKQALVLCADRLDDLNLPLNDDVTIVAWIALSKHQAALLQILREQAICQFSQLGFGQRAEKWNMVEGFFTGGHGLFLGQQIQVTSEVALAVTVCPEESRRVSV